MLVFILSPAFLSSRALISCWGPGEGTLCMPGQPPVTIWCCLAGASGPEMRLTLSHGHCSLASLCNKELLKYKKWEQVSIFVIQFLNQSLGKNNFQISVFVVSFCIVLRRLNSAKSKGTVALSGIFKSLLILGTWQIQYHFSPLCNPELAVAN